MAPRAQSTKLPLLVLFALLGWYNVCVSAEPSIIAAPRLQKLVHDVKASVCMGILNAGENESSARFLTKTLSTGTRQAFHSFRHPPRVFGHSHSRSVLLMARGGQVKTKKKTSSSRTTGSSKKRREKEEENLTS